MEEFEKLRSVGRGAFGVVYLCNRLSDGKKVIIKQIPVENLSVAERQAALGEAKVLQMLNHPNVIGYIANFIEENALCIVMEYAEGGTLWDFIQDRNGCFLKEALILNLFSQIILALHHLHSRQILHRDLKTQNILLNKQRTVCKLSDFGISKVLLTKSKASTVVGTPSYLSPEICEGKPYNQKSDIWALACILYELAALRRAFDAQSLPALILKIMHCSLLPLPAQFSEQFKQLVLSLFSLDPEKRPSTPQLLSHALFLKHVFSHFTDLGAIVCDRAHRCHHPNQMQITAPMVSSTVPAASLPVSYQRQTSELSAIESIAFIWGNGIALPQPLPVPSDVQIKEANIGSMHNCALTVDDRLLFWQDLDCVAFLEDSAPTYLPRFLELAQPMKIVQVSCGDTFGACVSDRGILMCFGNSPATTTLNNLYQARIVESLIGHCVREVACGASHLMALTTTNELFTWGKGDSGRLGHGSTQSLKVPKLVQLTQNYQIKRIYCSVDTSAFLCSDGSLFVTGNNSFNKIGLRSSGADVPYDKSSTKCSLAFTKSVAVPLIDLDCPQPVAFGNSHTAIISDGKLLMFGSNQFGQLGPRSNADNEVPAPVTDTQLEDVMFDQVVCGNAFTIAKGNLQLWTWGKETQLGRETNGSIIGTVNFNTQCNIRSMSSYNGRTTVTCDRLITHK